MKKRKSDSKRYTVAVIAFFLGIAIIIAPYPYIEKNKPLNLPETGMSSDFSLTLKADKDHIQMDDPTTGAQEINYTLKMSNLHECNKKPLHTILIVDNSGSEFEYFSDVQNTAKNIINAFVSDRNKFSIITIGNRAKVVRGLTNDKGRLIADISSMEARGFSMLSEGIDLAHALLVEDPDSSFVRPVLIIISDGFSYSSANTIDIQSQSLDSANKAKEDGITIASIGVGDVVDSKLLQEVSSNSDDLFFNSADLLDTTKLYSILLSDNKTSSFDSMVSVDMTLYNDVVKIIDISSGGRYESNSIIWDIGTLQCQEEYLLTFTIKIQKNVDDLLQVDLTALFENSSGEWLESNAVVSTIHRPLLNVDITDKSLSVYPGESKTYVISVKNEGTGDAYDLTIRGIFQPEYFIPDLDMLIGELQDSNTIIWNNDGAGYDIPGILLDENITSREFTFKGALKEGIIYTDNTLVQEIQVATANGYTKSAVDINQIYDSPIIALEIESDAKDEVYGGDILKYTITYTNESNLPLEDIPVLIDYDENILTIKASKSMTDNGSELLWNPGVTESWEKKSSFFTAEVLDLGNQGEIRFKTTISVNSEFVLIDETKSVLENSVTLITYPMVSISSFNTVVSANKEHIIPIDKAINNESSEEISRIYIQEKIPEEFRYVVDSASSIEGVKPVWNQKENVIFWNIESLSGGEDILLSYSVIPNTDIFEKNYITRSKISWEDQNGTRYEKEFFTTVINFNEEENVENEEKVKSSVTDISIKGLFEKNILNTFFKSGEWALYLKVMFGLILAIPFPVMLMYSGHKELLSILGGRRKKSKKKQTKRSK